MLNDTENGSCLVRSGTEVHTLQQIPEPVCETIGFYSVIEVDSIGFCGGFLVLNELGRPVEFHCTLPLNPEKAQTILYGQSLKPFLFAEHIGPSLIRKAKSKSPLILVNQSESLGLRAKIDQRVALIQSANEQRVGWKAADQADSATIDSWLQQTTLDLNEPFERIHSAIEEAHSVHR